MKLSISNVAKVKEAVIDIDGITVIAGENNTGKSTIGKVLFTIFKSMKDIDKKIEQEKKSRIFRIISSIIQSKSIRNDIHVGARRQSPSLIARRMTEAILEHINGENETELDVFIRNYVQETNLYKNEEEIQSFMDECINKVVAIIKIPDKVVMSEVITRWFNVVFENQISPLTNEGAETEIELTVRKMNIRYLLEANKCVNWESETNLWSDVFYIDNPFVMDKIDDFFPDGKKTEEELLKFLENDQDDIFDGIYDAVMAQEKLREIYELFDGVIEGEFTKNQDGEPSIRLGNCEKPLSLKNLSTGLKSFALIKMLIEKGGIKFEDVLILDEPEIHLHPEWQLIYAKLIVLLQKEFKLSMVITTHSPYFLDAIDVFSSAYNVSENVHYYLAENEGDTSFLRDVTGNIDEIYKKLSEPMQKLETLRYSMR